MTDEQRPWQDTGEYRDFLYAAGDPSPLTFWTEERDAALTKLLARVWREAQVHTIVIAGRHLIDAGKRQHSLKTALNECVRFEDEVRTEMLAERTRADAVAAQRDRLASVLEDVLDWIELDGTGNRSRIIRNARAALADVPDALARQVED